MKRASTAARKKSHDRADVDEYLASIPAPMRGALQKIRATIRAAAPGAEEGFSYGLPAFRLEGRPLVCYGASTNHCSFFPMSPSVIRAHASDLRNYETSKGTIRFAPEKPLPVALVRTLVKTRIAELRASRK